MRRARPVDRGGGPHGVDGDGAESDGSSLPPRDPETWKNVDLPALGLPASATESIVTDTPVAGTLLSVRPQRQSAPRVPGLQPPWTLGSCRPKGHYRATPTTPRAESADGSGIRTTERPD